MMRVGAVWALASLIPAVIDRRYNFEIGRWILNVGRFLPDEDRHPDVVS